MDNNGVSKYYHRDVINKANTHDKGEDKQVRIELQQRIQTRISKAVTIQNELDAFNDMEMEIQTASKKNVRFFFENHFKDNS